MLSFLGSPYVLATTEDKLHWYKYKFDQSLKAREFELLDVSDLRQVPLLDDKATAENAAKALGLKT